MSKSQKFLPCVNLQTGIAENLLVPVPYDQSGKVIVPLRVLYLPIKDKWFRMIEAGVKKEEYRERKPYWDRRLLGSLPFPDGCKSYKDYDAVHFRNGYDLTSPCMLWETTATEEKQPNPDWCEPADSGQLLYAIILGQRLHQRKPAPVSLLEKLRNRQGGQP